MLSPHRSETWHNAFASPCTSLAYRPFRQLLPRLGLPIPVARSAGVLAAFALMGLFHMYALAPVLPREGVARVGAFFMLNGVATVFEAMCWGRKRHWARVALAWAFEITVATWMAEKSGIPEGFSRLRWKEICEVGR